MLRYQVFEKDSRKIIHTPIKKYNMLIKTKFLLSAGAELSITNPERLYFMMEISPDIFIR